MVLVKLNDDGTNDYYVYEHDVLAERISCLYADYINIPKRDGSNVKILISDGSICATSLMMITGDETTGTF